MTSNSVINEYSTMTQNTMSTISFEQIKASFDKFVFHFTQADSVIEKFLLIEQVLSPLTNSRSNHRIIADSELMTHELLFILRDYVLIDQLRQKQTEENNKQEVILSTSTFIMNLCYCINRANTSKFADLLFHKLFIEEFALCIREISTHERHFYNPLHLRSIGYLLKAIKRALRYYRTTEVYSLISPIFSSVIQCLSSPSIVDMIKNLENNFNQKLDDYQTLFLDKMALYLKWYWYSGDSDSFIKILRILLNIFTTWFTSCPPASYLQRSSQMDSITRHLNYILVRPTEFKNVKLFSKEFYNDYCKLVLYWSSIFSSVFISTCDEITVKTTARTCVQILYNFTLHLNVLSFMKTIPDLIPFLLKATDLDHDEIQLNAYRCLGKIMIEKDIKSMAKPDKIASVHIDSIRKAIDDPDMTERFQSLLESLKNFVHHDQVKIELIEQEALALLIKCVVNHHFDPIDVQLIALEILFALSFQSDACSILRQNELFMSHIRILTTNTESNELRLQRAAEGLLWKLEKEDEAITKTTILHTYEYDIMMSYSHKDEESCLKIHEKLIQDGFRVWLDRYCLRGSTMVGIADAIENSKYVIICMSNTYKQSVYCQSEAHYAFERGCCLIPILVESNYKPDGWLGIITSGKIYVDFVRNDLESAYEKLKSEIREQQSQTSLKSVTKTESYEQSKVIHITAEHPQSGSQPIISLPHCINEWTNDHVKSFFLHIGLQDTMLLLARHVDGPRLLQLYEMCLINRESMYQSLKFELNESFNKLLPISHYLTFLQQIAPYIPSTSRNTKTTHFPMIPYERCSLF